MIAQGRCLVDVGTGQSTLDVLLRIKTAVHDGLPISPSNRAFMIDYLSTVGVELGRVQPPAWFFWIDERENGLGARAFAGKCCDPDHAFPDDDGVQPFDFYVVAHIDRYLRKKGQWSATALDLLHNTEMLRRPPPALQ